MVFRTGLWERLGGSARVTVVSAPPGSGKTVLLRSWIDAAGLAERAAWMPVGHDERDPRRLWLSVLGALRQTAPAAQLVRELTATPDLDGQAGTVHRLLAEAPPGARAGLSGELRALALRNLYAKLGVHSRSEAVESGRALSLLAPSARSAPAGHARQF